MKETLHGANGLDETRVRRAFGWVITFRDFPIGSWQTVGGDAMMSEALTLFTKGRAEFYLDGIRRGDRVPGILSSEHEIVGQDGIFELRYVEPTTRLCIPSIFNRGRLPMVKKRMFKHHTQFLVQPGQHFLVCMGDVTVGEKQFAEETTFSVVSEPMIAVVPSGTILLEFLDAAR